MEFKLGQKVKMKASSTPVQGAPSGRGIIVGMLYNANIFGGVILITIRHNTSNSVYNYRESDITLLKTSKLFAYTDSTDEVHWATKSYNKEELKQFGFKRAEAFDKEIDLE